MENQKLWYVVNTYSGHESKVKENLLMRKDSMGMGNNILELLFQKLKKLKLKMALRKKKQRRCFQVMYLLK